MISPAARKHAQEKGLDIEAIAGSGPHGAVTLEDVEHAAQAKTAAPHADKGAEMRRAIAAAMARSKREIPHYYVAEPISMGTALAWLAHENARRSMAERLLPAALLLKAVALALKRFPELNGFFRDGAFQAAASVHVGVAISLRQGGLIAPALLDADGKPLTQLMQELTDLVKRCRAGSLRSSEMSGPTVTVTNLGDQGTESVFGVIYPPQVALVGFGRITERPWAENGGLKLMPAVTASLSADHRVSDGHHGALFLIELRELLQRPRHPYTEGLLRASPQLGSRGLAPIPGSVPALDALPPGCAFAPRCAYRRDQCSVEPPRPRHAGPDHFGRCILISE